MIVAWAALLGAPVLAQQAAPPPSGKANATDPWALAAEKIPTVKRPEVKPAGPGVFTLAEDSPTSLQLTVAGSQFTSREQIEQYLAYRAAELTVQKGDQWFSFVEQRSKGDTAPAPKADPAGPRFSFRMEYFRPVWRYKTTTSPDWKSWSPFTGAPFWADGVDPKIVTAFEVSANIALRKGHVQDDHPLAFDGPALFDHLINQVEPPQ